MMTPLTVLFLAAGPAMSDTWTCDVPYDEVNGGGTVTIRDDRLIFESNWPHRAPQDLGCLKLGQLSECMSATLTPTRDGGATVVAQLFSVVWQVDGGPTSITIKQPKALFRKTEEGHAMTGAFPAIGHSFPVTDCKTD